MIIIIPIGGIGKRFKDNGYTKPKSLINVFGNMILSYVIENLNLDEIDYIFIPYNNEYKAYNFEDMLRNKYKNIKFKFHCLLHNTIGAAETINIGLNNLNEPRDIPVICIDSDNFYSCDIISKWKGENCVFTFNDTNKEPIYSYIKFDNNKITDIREKEKISDYACTGAYGFNSIKNLKKYTSKIVLQKNEFYTSGVIDRMISDGHVFKNITIDANDFTCLGTPFQIKLFYNNFPKKSALNDKITIEQKRICFDLDNTLVSFPTIQNDYTSVKPLTNNIIFLRYLKKIGNIIIIHTARRMKTHGGNIGKLNKDICKITLDTLEKFDIPYAEIYFGKPYADFYIDDLAINCFDNLEKETGFYNNKIETRKFNSIENNFTETITKNGNVDGEIYYYENIPNKLKDLFPLYFGNNKNSFTIEKIKGITLSDLYLSGLLSKNTLSHVLNSIIRIQKEYTEEKVNIYDIYDKKLIERYSNYDYSQFDNSYIIYKELLSKLEKYKNDNCGKMTIIHGDPVFTNIIINNYDKIKFIDMRGKIGNNLTICGDWLYDWAKIYQSLIGYDEILLYKTIDQNYKDEMISFFKDFFINKYSISDFENLKIITKSLLFTLIPLHDNNKCNNYYNLIFSKYLVC